MRHAEAVSASQWSRPDSERPLSPIGEATVEAGAKEMKRLGFTVPLVLSSPFIRAKDTAIILCKVLGLPAPTLNTDLSSGVSVETLRKVAQFAIKNPVLLVGHNPEISHFGSKLTFEPKLLDGGFDPADMALITLDGPEIKWGEGKLVWWRRISDWKSVKT